MRMSEVKDPAIKLFGKTITLSPIEHAFDHRHNQQPSCTSSQDNKNNSGGEVIRIRPEDDPISLSDDESIEPLSQSQGCDTPKTPNADRETLSPKQTTKEEQSETNVSQEKTLKKPDKILPCPRCNSMDTKFCYYNNYNVNQPRHFCKKCQRYWTAGGTMRNVPVGSGRRKNKNSCGLNYRHIIVSEALQAAQADGANGIHMSSLKADGTVFAFSSERPLCESMASALDLAGNDHSNGFGGFSSARPELIEKGGSVGTQDSVLKNFQGFTPQVPCFPGAPWPSQWNSAHWSPPTTPHPFNPSGFPMTFYPASPYWGCAVQSPWNVPWLSPPPCPSQPSPTLGKHYRDESMLTPSNMKKLETIKEKDAEGSVQLQKTLRIDDSDEAVNSSICSSPGMTSNNKDSFSGTSLFKAFLPRIDERNQVADTSRVLQANPAAFSRSINFQEST